LKTHIQQLALLFSNSSLSLKTCFQHEWWIRLL